MVCDVFKKTSSGAERRGVLEAGGRHGEEEGRRRSREKAWERRGEAQVL